MKRLWLLTALVLVAVLASSLIPVATQAQAPRSQSRPSASYLHGPFVSVRIALESTWLIGSPHGPHVVSRVVHTAVLDRAAIRRLVSAVNSIKSMVAAHPPCTGSRIPPTGGSRPAAAWLAFVRTNGLTVHGFEPGPAPCGGLAVNGVKWLADDGRVWDQILALTSGRG